MKEWARIKLAPLLIFSDAGSSERSNEVDDLEIKSDLHKSPFSHGPF